MLKIFKYIRKLHRFITCKHPGAHCLQVQRPPHGEFSIHICWMCGRIIGFHGGKAWDCLDNGDAWIKGPDLLEWNKKPWDNI